MRRIRIPLRAEQGKSFLKVRNRERKMIARTEEVDARVQLVRQQIDRLL
jgi:hypothetical protein